MQRKGIYYGWYNVGIGTISMAFAPTVMAFFTLGVYMPILVEEFGWTRTQISAASMIGTLSSAVFTPFIGRGVDAVGGRVVIVAAVTLFAITFSSFYFLEFSLAHFFIGYFVIGATAPVTTLSYTRTITAWFNRRRGIALGLAMAGTGIGAAILPPLAQYLIELYGWRLSYVLLGLLAMLVSVPIVAMFLRETPLEVDVIARKSMNMSEDPSDTPLTDYGMTRAEAISTWCLWKLVVIFLVVAVALHAVTVHLVPIIIDAGVSPLKAAAFMTVYGLTVVIGRLACGFTVDHVFAPFVASGVFLLSAIGMLLLLFNPNTLTISIAAALIGLGIGAETDLLGYLVGRYFGLKKFGELYGFVFSAFMIGTSIGPVFLGFMYDLTSSYQVGLMFLTGLMVFSAFMSLQLGKFPDWR